MEKARPTQLVLVRHGESERNAAKKGAVYFADDDARSKIRGVPDQEVPLTTLGVFQARRTGQYLARNLPVPDYVYHSGYLRTIQTTQGILMAFPEEVRERIRVRENHFIRERDPGYAYDMTEEEAEMHFPWLAEHWKTFGGYLARPPGGESLAEVSHRVHTFLNTLFRDRAGKRVWVVMHGGTLRTFRMLLERWTYKQCLTWPEGQSPANCGVTIYNFDRKLGRLILQEYNKTCC